MEPLDVIEDVTAGFVLSPIVPMVNAFPFEHTEEAFAGCVIIAVTNSTYTAHQIVADQEALEVSTGKLGTI